MNRKIKIITITINGERIMNRKIKIITNCFLAVAVMLLLVTCGSQPQSVVPNGTTQRAGNLSTQTEGNLPTQTAAPNRTAQTARSYSSNGERIYFSSTSDRGTNITYTDGPTSNGMMGNDSQGGMMGNDSQGGMMGNDSQNGVPGNDSQNGVPGNGSQGGMMGLSCAVCHSSDGRGGVHTTAGMQTMNAPDIRWSTLKDEFDAEKFRLAVTQGQDPDGKKMLNRDMPRWKIGNEDLADLIGFLKTL
ncbi:cytochrome c [Spirulina sp. 06S082]|uniref:c-type cytochrome n=1 Tax=Spirulina sp. 06S082 TaxID=3110248 RepID=UPI002B2036BC|nr:cytochrome c [Spirulina sp. 06S082]MEA5468273.1 cytochrome c [Spirulina sp. 06S082]